MPPRNRLNAQQRKLAKKYDIKTKGRYYKSHGFDNKKDFWDAVIETDAIQREIEEEDKKKAKNDPIRKLTTKIFKNVKSKITRDENRRRARQLQADYYFDRIPKKHTIEYTFKNRNSEIGNYSPQDVYDFVLANLNDIKTALTVNSEKKGIKAKISALVWWVNSAELAATLSKSDFKVFEKGRTNENILAAIDSLKQKFYTGPHLEYETLYQATDKQAFITKQSKRNQDVLEEIVETSSGAVIVDISKVYVNIITNINPLTGSSYIPLPTWLANKQCCINIKNNDNKCSMWAIKCFKFHLLVKHHRERISHYKKIEDDTDYSMLQYPTPIEDWAKYERANDEKVVVLGVGSNNKPVPLYNSKYKSPKDKAVIWLMLVEGEKDGVACNHYVPITSISALLYSEFAHHEKAHVCHYCLKPFWSIEKRDAHIALCEDHDACRTIFPSKEQSIMRFRNYKNQQWCPYIVIADGEAFTEKIAGCRLDLDRSFTEAYQKHKSSGLAYAVIHSPNPGSYKVVSYEMFDGENKVNDMILALDKLSKKIKFEIKDNIPMEPLTPEQQEWFENANCCHICKCPFTEGQKKVRDHDHATGRYRGAAHNACNLNYNLQHFKLPVFFHNFERYDLHMIMNELSVDKKQFKLTPVAKNKEHYMQLGINNFVFKDSYKHLQGSLAELVEGLHQDQFHCVTTEFKDKTPLMLRKGVFPYDWWDAKEKRDYPSLPPKEAFYSALYDEHITQKDYEHAQLVWKEFDCKTMKDYHDLYLKSDILLLADVFMNYRKECHTAYGLDPTWYMTSHQFSWEAALKYTKVELELLTNPDMYLMFEAGIRGGISMISHRHGKANNPYLPGYDSKKATSHLMYWDANNLYGNSMSKHLPVGSFQWVCPELFPSVEQIMSMSSDDKWGYMLMVDWEYPKELHDLHHDYPLAVERMKVTHDMLSPFTKNLMEKLENSGLGISHVPTEKLVGTLSDKEGYVCHYMTMKLYLSLGLKVKKIHKVIKFKQEAWLKPFVVFNTKKRAQATTKFQQDFYKLTVNGVFGKTMENIRNRINFKLYYNQDKLVNRAKSRFDAKDLVEFNDNLVGVMFRKTQVRLCKPIYVGFTVLELSKHLMYDFHYNFVVKHFGRENVQLIFTDTDSLCYRIQTDNIYRDIKENIHMFDTSNYPKEHECYSSVNKKVPGLMKDVNAGVPMDEIVAIKAKMYAYRLPEKGEDKDEDEDKENEKKVAKGIKKCVIKKSLNFDTFKEVLFEHAYTRNTMNVIRSQNHKLQTVKVNKVGLTPIDDKRWYLEDGITSLPYGHYRTFL